MNKLKDFIADALADRPKFMNWLNNCEGSRIKIEGNNGKVLDRDITIKGIIIEDDLTDTEDYRMCFSFKDMVITLWYLPTRVENVVYITEYAVEF